jgi:hypothetical protein
VDVFEQNNTVLTNQVNADAVDFDFYHGKFSAVMLTILPQLYTLKSARQHKGVLFSSRLLGSSLRLWVFNCL